MPWQICECTNPVCALRFPAESDDGRRLHCPLCGSATVCVPALEKQSIGAQSGAQSGAPGSVHAPLYVILDNLRSSYNVGSILRTSDAVGVNEIHLCGITPTPTHPKVAKTALGAEVEIAWQYHRNALHIADKLRADGVVLWALEIHPQARSLVDAPPLTQPTALIVGSETCGVDPALLARCDHVFALPMLGSKGSLNVASAAAVALYWLRFHT